MHMKNNPSLAEIHETLSKILSTHIGSNHNFIEPGLLLKDDLGLDSFSIVELVYEVEITFNISLNNHDLSSLTAIGDLQQLIATKIGKSNAKDILSR